MKGKTLQVDGNHLRLEDVALFVSDSSFKLRVSPVALIRVRASHSFVANELGERVVYGVNTGFGPMASFMIGPDKLVTLQYNLVRSHASGIGNPLPERYVAAAMIVRLNTLLRGYSGVSEELIHKLVLFLNRRIFPVVPEHGAVGTSGDLVQLAHIALALIGEGEVLHEGKRQATAKVLQKLGILPHVLLPKEGLSLINGTSLMSGIGALGVLHAERLLSLALRAGALALESVSAYSDGILSELHELRPHSGQKEAARVLRELVRASEFLRDRARLSKRSRAGVEHINDDVQEFYSFRCIPQILGPVLDTIRNARGVLQIEINSVTDNPIVDVANKKFLHGGNFHGEYVATALDEMKAGLVKLTMLSERRTNYFLHAKINHRFPPFLNMDTPGLTLALQGLQFVSTSTTALSQTYAFPHRVHSIPTNNDNQDLVSMGADAALLFMKVVEQAYIVLGIELVSLCQTVDILKGEQKLSESSRELYRAVRAIIPPVIQDRPLSLELQSLISFLQNTERFDISFRLSS